MSYKPKPFTLEEAKLSVKSDLDNWSCINGDVGKVSVSVEALRLILSTLDKYESYILNNL